MCDPSGRSDVYCFVARSVLSEHRENRSMTAETMSGRDPLSPAEEETLLSEENESASSSHQACISRKTRKLLGPEDFSGLFSGEFLGSRKALLNAPENTPDSHPSFSGCFLGFAARA